MSESLQAAPASPAPHSKNHDYTVVIRLPFPRNGFEDPAPVEWNAAKDNQLWQVISTSANKNLNWEEISSDFHVSLPFLLQQAAWLYERHFAGVKAQLKKIGGGVSGPEGTAAGGGGSGSGSVAVARTGSGDSKFPSHVSTSNVTAIPAVGIPPDLYAGALPSPPKAAKPIISRTPSSGTITQSRVLGGAGGSVASSSKQAPLQRALRGSSGSGRKPTLLRPETPRNEPRDEHAVDAEQPADSDSDSDHDAGPRVLRSQAFRRLPLSKKPNANKQAKTHRTAVPDDTIDDASGESGDEDDDEEYSGGFLPFAASAGKVHADNESAETTRLASLNKKPLQPALKQRPKLPDIPAKPESFTATTEESSTSSVSSAALQPGTALNYETSVQRQQQQNPQQQRLQAGTLSPRHRAQLASLSPRGSEGSPSMGSSFSDLDDASVTQSALEEALMSNMRHGNLSSMASRMGSIRDVLGRRADGH